MCGCHVIGLLLVVVFFDFPERFSELLWSTCGPFWNGRKKEHEKPRQV